MHPGYSSQDVDRRVLEKNRRQKMKNLCSVLGSLLPPPTSEFNQEKLVLPALLDQSVEYVNHLKASVDELKARKEQLQGDGTSAIAEGLILPYVVINEKGRIQEVNLVTGSNRGFLLPKIIRILQEEGAEVLSANYSNLRDRILYTIIIQAFSSRIGIETSRAHERLKALLGV